MLTDKDIRELLRKTNGEHSQIERVSEKHLTELAKTLARQLLAAMSVVRAAEAYAINTTTIHGPQRFGKLCKSLDAFERSRKIV